MIKIINIFLLFFLVTSSPFAQSNDSLVKDIRANYKYIRTNLSTFDTTAIDIWDESTEGGKGIAYYESGILMMIQVVWYGETGKKMIEYYFKNENLIFAFDQNFKYNASIFFGEERADEVGINNVFDETKTVIIEDRYYFDNRHLFLWLNNDKQQVDLTQGTNSITGKNLIIHSNEMKAKLKK